MRNIDSSDGAKAGTTRRDFLRLGAATALTALKTTTAGALFAACAEETPPVCATPERQTATAPKVEIDRVVRQGNLVRTYFSTPDFDVDCKGPVTVSLMAKVRTNGPTAEDEANYGNGDEDHSQQNSATVSLGTKEVWQSGEDMVEGVIPEEWELLDSVTLKVVDAQGTEYETPTKIVN